jgi:hypothetical protein
VVAPRGAARAASDRVRPHVGLSPGRRSAPLRDRPRLPERGRRASRRQAHVAVERDVAVDNRASLRRDHHPAAGGCQPRLGQPRAGTPRSGRARLSTRPTAPIPAFDLRSSGSGSDPDPNLEPTAAPLLRTSGVPHLADHRRIRGATDPRDRRTVMHEAAARARSRSDHARNIFRRFTLTQFRIANAERLESTPIAREMRSDHRCRDSQRWVSRNRRRAQSSMRLRTICLARSPFKSSDPVVAGWRDGGWRNGAMAWRDRVTTCCGFR